MKKINVLTVVDVDSNSQVEQQRGVIVRAAIKAGASPAGANGAGTTPEWLLNDEDKIKWWGNQPQLVAGKRYG